MRVSCGTIAFVLLVGIVQLGVTAGEDGLYNSLIVKYGREVDPNHERSYYRLPRTTEEALHDYWAPVNDQLKKHHVTMWCRNKDYRLCLLFDKKGAIAGLQLSIAFEEFCLDQGNHVQFFRTEVSGVDVLSIRVLFVSEKILKRGGRSITKETPTAPNGVYVYQRPNHLLHVSKYERDASKAGLNPQACSEGMGQHYCFANTTSKCDNIEPFFNMYNAQTGIMHAFGIAAFVNPSIETGGRAWLESPSALDIKYITPNSGPCLVDYINKYGIMNLHVFFTKYYDDINCNTEYYTSPVKNDRCVSTFNPKYSISQ